MNEKIIAAVRSNEELNAAIKSDVGMIFMLAPNIDDISAQARLVHDAGKKFFIHIDLAEGIGKDEYGIRFAKKLGVDGIISTRTNIIKTASRVGVSTVQRFFIVDSHSVDTSIEAAKQSKADMIEIMPGTVAKVIKRMKEKLEMPIVAGGLVETYAEIDEAISCGAAAVSTGKKEFWK
ncbi:MAG: glycerol-3-phosphate responsive antiterminator [Clostridia bacterium]|nr:glycerol-3-phosphate responsive antiterminator [Clostridia bacterium]